MPTTIKLKNSVTTTNAPSSLAQGEVAINVTDKKVWVGNAATTPVLLLGSGADGTFTNLTVSGVASFADGTVSLPSITNIGDTNTGIFFPAADTIAFTEGGVESMRIDSSGNVMLGTTTAQELLTVNKNAAFGTTADAFSEIRFFNSTITGGTTRVRATAGDLTLITSNTERMRITAGGDVGIGTSSPNATLQLNASSAALRITGVTNTSGILLGVREDGQEVQLLNSANGAFRFGTNNTERMRIDSSGNLMVGTTSSVGRLTVSQGTKATTAAVTNIAGFNTTDASSLGLFVRQKLDATAANRWTGLMSFDNGVGAAPLVLQDLGSNVLIGTTANNTAGGVLQISNGITFPATQNASSDANTLDDYEEGTWTPVLTRTGSAPTISYQFREGKYTKIGNMVTCWITVNSITVSAAGSGTNTITGLPFAIGNQTYAGSGGFGYNDAFVNAVYGVILNNNLTQIYFRNGTRGQSDDNGGWNNGGYLGLTFTYFTAN
jgi:hypothetical protein